MRDDKGQRIAVLGAGASGVAAARLATEGGAAWVGVYDSGNDSAKLAEAGAALSEAGVETVFGKAALAAPAGLDLVVVSPGIDMGWPLGEVFAATGAPVLGELEYAFQHTDFPMVAITGTNGKTTTTELTDAIFNACGIRSVAAGNYGLPLCDVVRSGEKYDVVTLEVSSFQLETIDRFRPRVAVWLNFAPDHMDRYKALADYRNAKLRIFENQTAEDFAVINGEDSLGTLAAETVTFSAFSPGADFSWENGEIRFRGETVFRFGEGRLNGKHNAENVMAAMAAVHRFGVEFEAMVPCLREYQAPPHRCEPVGVIGGVTFINDSKATNLHALESSLRGQESPVILIAGGKNKGLDYAEVKGAVSRSVREVIAIGEMASRVCEAWGDAVPCARAESLADAVRLAAGAARSGETVLFSPGTSSFDMFSGYGERGNAFRACVAALRKS